MIFHPSDKKRRFKTQAIVAAAGSGTRLDASGSKMLLEINGKPLIVYSLETLSRSGLIDSVIVVASEELIKVMQTLIKSYGLVKVKRTVAGGPTRVQSVANGLKTLDADTDLVLIHDGARPLVADEIIERAVTACYSEPAVIVGVPVKPTIKRINPQDKYVEATFDRRLLWEVQTPQVFQKAVILKAHRENNDLQATDDAYLVEMIGERVKVVEGSYSNIKVTTKEDIDIACGLLKV